MKKIGNEKSILSTYIITTKTYALIPTRSTDHQTKVIEKDHIYYVNQSPLELIKLNCLLNGSDFTGRAKSIAYHLNFKRMSPVAINKRIHAFPTHSLADFECMWIFLKQIAYTKPNGNKSMIVFKNYAEFPLPISTHILEKQILRCHAVSNLFDHMQSEPIKSHEIVTKLV